MYFTNLFFQNCYFNYQLKRLIINHIDLIYFQQFKKKIRKVFVHCFINLKMIVIIITNIELILKDFINILISLKNIIKIIINFELNDYTQF